MSFEIVSKFIPTGDQPQAIEKLVNGILQGERAQVLLGVTGSGKTFTMANVIKEINKPTLILTHNKTLTAQLYGEFKEFFPDNAVEFFVSYYDYYQPEAYIPSSDLYIEKDLNINEEVDKLRLRATSSLLSGRQDVIIVSSVSCIYGMGNPEDYTNSIIRLSKGDQISRNSLLLRMVDALYSRNDHDLTRGNFRVRGDIIDVALSYVDYGLRIHFYGNEIEKLEYIELPSSKPFKEISAATIFPANLYVAPKERIHEIMRMIEHEMEEQVRYLESEHKFLEAKRVKERTRFDIEMIKELGYCSGIENYSRFFDGRQPGARPFCLLDYFPKDFLMFIDESHATIPQVKGMWGGDRARKTNLVNFGFRLPSAMDNRPLNFQEFESVINNVIFVSATPGDYELELTQGLMVEQVIRPTGLVDPPIEVRPSINQIDDLLIEVEVRVSRNERILVTTLTKRMAEELAKYFQNLRIKTRYIHSEVDTLERMEILRDLRIGEFDVLVGVNLLREGLDLPEVSLVAVIDADKEGFLRNNKSLTQIAGRAARNVNGKVVFYADKITDSMQNTIDETNRRRAVQMQYNADNGITPKTLAKSKEEILSRKSILDIRGSQPKGYENNLDLTIAADPLVTMMNQDQIARLIEETEIKMKKAAKDLDFLTAAQHRDEIINLKKRLK